MVVDRDRIATAFERAPGLVDRLSAEAPFPSAEAALARAGAIVAAMTEAERIAVLAAHPRIGAGVATLSDASRREQGADGDARVRAELERLNDAYERRFGFRFVVFVAGRSKAEIVPVLRERMTHAREDELSTGVAELLAIARDRLAS